MLGHFQRRVPRRAAHGSAALVAAATAPPSACVRVGVSCPLSLRFPSLMTAVTFLTGSLPELKAIKGIAVTETGHEVIWRRGRGGEKRPGACGQERGARPTPTGGGLDSESHGESGGRAGPGAAGHGASMGSPSPGRRELGGTPCRGSAGRTGSRAHGRGAGHHVRSPRTSTPSQPAGQPSAAWRARDLGLI